MSRRTHGTVSAPPYDDLNMNRINLKERTWNMKRIVGSILIALLVLSVVASTPFAAQPAQASRQCPAPGTGRPGALNMLHDATMWTIPMARDTAQGNAGMFIAVGKSGC